LFSLFIINEDSESESSYIKSIWVNGLNYIIPENHEYYFGDSDAYNKFAYSLIERGDFYNPLGEKSAWVTPGYPLFLSFIYYIFGYRYIPVLIFQNILLSLTYLFIFNIIFFVTNSNLCSFIGIVICFINIRFTQYVSYIYSEILFLFLLSFITYVFLLLLKDEIRSRKVVLYLLLGFLSGFILLVRPIALPFIILLYGILLYVNFFVKKLNHFYITITIFTTLFIFSIWIYRNYLIFNRLVISTSSEMTVPYLDLDNFSFFKNYSIKEFIKYHTNFNIFNTVTIEELNKQKINLPLGKEHIIKFNGYHLERFSNKLNKEKVNWIVSNPLKYSLRTLYLFKSIIFPYTNNQSFRNKLLTSLIWILIVLPTFIYLFMKRKNKFYYLFLFAGISLIILPTFTVIDSYLRYRLPFELVFIIPASLFWCRVIKFISNYKT